MKEPVVSRILRCVLYVGFCVGAAAVITLPFMFNRYAEILHDGYLYASNYKIFITVFLMIAGLLGLWIIAELIFVMRTIRGDPFVRRNVTALRRIGSAALAIGNMFIIKCIPFLTFLTLVSGVVFIVCALVVFTLCALFAQAVRYKEENELTI